MSSFKTLTRRVIAAMFLASIFTLSAPAPSVAQSSRASGMLCANEGGRCSFSGSRFVRYGAGDRFSVRLLTDGTDCTNAVFGDPIFGQRKACYIETAIFPTQRCADEDGRCRFVGTRDVYFGAGERFTVRTLTDGTDCTNVVFGDPALGVRKACYIGAVAPARRAVLCANEDGRCEFNGSRMVYFGAGDRYFARVLTNGTSCSNAVFGDPALNVRKVCYVER